MLSESKYPGTVIKRAAGCVMFQFYALIRLFHHLHGSINIKLRRMRGAKVIIVLFQKYALKYFEYYLRFFCNAYFDDLTLVAARTWLGPGMIAAKEIPN